METLDGFIIGIYNYCDRWCERCPLTGRCRMFADEQRMSFGIVPPALASGAATDAGDAAAADLEDEAHGNQLMEPVLTAADCQLHERVGDLGRRLSLWVVPESRAADPEVIDAAEVLNHFGFFIGPKVYRALIGRARVGDDRVSGDGFTEDAVGSAKVAILALDRLGEAWLRLAERGAISLLEAAPVLSELQRLTAALDRLFPGARAFVRPGLDQPTEVARLEWSERG